MTNSVKLIIHKGRLIFDGMVITPYSLIHYEPKVIETDSRNNTNTHLSTVNQNVVTPLKIISLNKNGYNAYFVSLYVTILTNSETYRNAAFKKLVQYLSNKLPHTTICNTVLIKLRMPKKQFLDYKWNERITRMVLERREIDHAMSWLSTLGGAFSALGEEFEHCAEMAGKISLQQFELALRLGDPLLVARCRLYAALSFIQRGELNVSQRIVRKVYKFSISQKDIRLQKMCQGIWAKLKYCFKMCKEKHKVA